MIRVTAPRPRRDSNDRSLIPLINVVFLLLAFFMIVGQIQQMDTSDVTPPESLSEREAEEAEYTLAVNVEGGLTFNNEPIQRVQLVDTLRDIADSMSSGRTVALFVVADEMLPAKDLFDVLADVQDAGIAQIALATRPVYGSGA